MSETGVRAAMLMKDLCSHAWISDTYGTALPDLPWLQKPRTPALLGTGRHGARA